MFLGIDPGRSGAVVVEAEAGAVWWALWLHRRRRAGDVWRVLDSDGHVAEVESLSMAVMRALPPGFDLSGCTIETWARGSGPKTAAAHDGMVRAGGVAQAVVEAIYPGTPIGWVDAPTWRRQVLAIRQTARERAERHAVEVALGDGGGRMPAWTLPQPPDVGRVHVAEARCLARWGMRHGAT